MMSSPNTRGIEQIVGNNGCMAWNRLHSEREEICEALLKETACNFAVTGPASESRELLQSRLRRIDDALDRMFSGSYGHCSNCGKQIESSVLDTDPAAAFCDECGDVATLEGIALNSLQPFDTIRINTQNSDYRVFLLDPEAGRVLIEGGQYFVEPAEAVISGSTSGNWLVNNKWIGVGMRVEMWVGDKFIITSPVRDIHVEHHAASQVEMKDVVHH